MKRLVNLFVSVLLLLATVSSLSSCAIKRVFAFLYDCETCYDEGAIECSACEGENVTDCTLCDGSGERECDVCSGFGRKKCAECGGDGGRYSAFSALWFDCFYLPTAMLLVQKLCRAVALTVRELAPIAELRVLLIALIVNNSLLYYIKRVIAK